MDTYTGASVIMPAEFIMTSQIKYGDAYIYTGCEFHRIIYQDSEILMTTKDWVRFCDSNDSESHSTVRTTVHREHGRWPPKPSRQEQAPLVKQKGSGPKVMYIGDKCYVTKDFNVDEDWWQLYPQTMVEFKISASDLIICEDTPYEDDTGFRVGSMEKDILLQSNISYAFARQDDYQDMPPLESL